MTITDADIRNRIALCETAKAALAGPPFVIEREAIRECQAAHDPTTMAAVWRELLAARGLIDCLLSEADLTACVDKRLAYDAARGEPKADGGGG